MNPVEEYWPAHMAGPDVDLTKSYQADPHEIIGSIPRRSSPNAGLVVPAARGEICVTKNWMRLLNQGARAAAGPPACGRAQVGLVAALTRRPTDADDSICPSVCGPDPASSQVQHFLEPIGIAHALQSVGVFALKSTDPGGPLAQGTENQSEANADTCITCTQLIEQAIITVIYSVGNGRSTGAWTYTCNATDTVYLPTAYNKGGGQSTNFGGQVHESYPSVPALLVSIRYPQAYRESKSDHQCPRDIDNYLLYVSDSAAAADPELRDMPDVPPNKQWFAAVGRRALRGDRHANGHGMYEHAERFGPVGMNNGYTAFAIPGKLYWYIEYQDRYCCAGYLKILGGGSAAAGPAPGSPGTMTHENTVLEHVRELEGR